MNVKTREKDVKSLSVGWGEVEVVAINPSKEELIKLMDIGEEYQEDFKDPVYCGEKEGIETARIAFYVKNIKTNKINPISFFLEKRVRMSKDGNKMQFVNCHGLTGWADSKENLMSFFTHFENVLDWKATDGTINKRYTVGSKPNTVETLGEKFTREAMVGEEELYNFVRDWLVSVDYRDVDTNLLMATDKFFAGDFKELQDLVGSSIVSTIVVPYTIKTREVDGVEKEFQHISNKFCLPGSQAKLLRNYMLDNNKLAVIMEKHATKRKLTPVEAFYAETMDTEYGIKEFYLPYECQDYTEDMNYINSTENSAVTEENDIF